jgi:cytochrome c-type biogenesis protein CcsB
MLDEALSQISLMFVYGAMGVLSLSLFAFSFHLARLASNQAEAREAAKAAKAMVSVSAGGAEVADEAPAAAAGSSPEKISKIERVAIALLVLATLTLGVGVILRGIAANRVPWANMYEYTISGVFVVLIIYLIAMVQRDLRFIATLITGSSLLFLGTATTLFYVEVQTLMPALQSFWLVIHVMVAIMATAFFNIGAALHAAYLIKTARSVNTAESGGGLVLKRVFDLFPNVQSLDRWAYRSNILGFVFWTFTLIAGAIWAERAWHRYWGWDTKEVWTFIIWVLYAGYLHAKATRGWDGRRAAYLGLIAFGAVIFNFTIVNMFFEGLHVYSGL